MLENKKKVQPPATLETPTLEDEALPKNVKQPLAWNGIPVENLAFWSAVVTAGLGSSWDTAILSCSMVTDISI